MLLDEKWVRLALSKLTEDDFFDPTCRNFFRVIRELTVEGRPIDPVPVMSKLKDDGEYLRWYQQLMTIVTSPANSAEYINQVLEDARVRRFRELCAQGENCQSTEEASILNRKMSAGLSATDRMPRMTAPQWSADFLERARSDKKPEYLPWGIPTADRCTYAELGDMILLGGYASSGKTLLSLLMAMTQARRGYKIGYYSLETSPAKMADRVFSSLTKIPLNKIKTRSFSGKDWEKIAQASIFAATECPFDIIQAAGSTVDDIISDAIGHAYQIIYIDYVQLVQVPGIRPTEEYARITVASQTLKIFAQNSHTAVVALAQLTRPKGTESKRKGEDDGPEMPTMNSFKGSGQLEQDADAAFLIFPSQRKRNDCQRIFRIAKNKEGAQPMPFMMEFQGSTQTMVELGSEGLTMEDWAELDQVELGELEEDNPFA